MSFSFGSHRFAPGRCLLALAAMLAVMPWQTASAQNLQEFEKHVTEFTLPNGMHFIVVERHEAPVVSFETYVNVGSVDDPKGETGLAHMFEHMAFKGTREIGSKNWAEEKKALAAEDAAYQALDHERALGWRADKAKLAHLQTDFAAKQKAAEALVIPNEYPRLIEVNGGVGMNAETAEDDTQFFYSLPSNRTELWFYLESERFLHPVFREFYKERSVVAEERRMRVDSNPEGKLIENLLGTAFEASPYKNSGVGWPSDLNGLTMEDAQAFFQKYYVPANFCEVIVGDVQPAQVRQWANEYFGRLPKRPAPLPNITHEPEQDGPRSVKVLTPGPTQPIAAVAYHTPSEHNPDRAVFDVISSILSSGRTSWFYRNLVEKEKVALYAGGYPDFPGTKYPNLFVFLDVPAPGHSVAENLKAMQAQIDRLKTQPVDEATLHKVQTKARAGMIRSLESNSGLAGQLAYYYTNFGDWRELFRQLQEIEAVTPADIQRVAKTYFTDENKTTAWLAQSTPTAPASAQEVH